jgi:leucyl aminopeptidase
MNMTSPLPLTTDATGAIPTYIVTEKNFGDYIAGLTSVQRQWIANYQFTGKPETSLLIPSSDDTPIAVIGATLPLHIWSIAHAPAQLPIGVYRIESELDAATHSTLAAGCCLAQYQFARYRKSEPPRFTYVVPNATIITQARHVIDAVTLVRDLINTPTNDMGPTELADAAQDLAARIGAECTIIRGDDLLVQNYPAIHAVGRAATNPPCLIDLRWGDPTHPKLTLVGKGVCFDTGGLDIKPYVSMKLMKKDMGGAALVLGLAQWIAATQVPVRLRVLIPAVENAIAGNAFRPQDVLATRKGLTMEIGSTDAEGRVILADALHEADSESPDMIIDVATLTGAARAALGTEIPAMFSLTPETGETLARTSLNSHDPLWQLPLWAGYERYLKSPIADITNSPNYGYAGCITAALFLKRFISNTREWIHLDTMAWNVDTQAGRPVGGEALGLRALHQFIRDRYGSK